MMKPLLLFSVILCVVPAPAGGQQPNPKPSSRPSETRRSDDATIAEVAIWGLGENSPEDVRSRIKTERGTVVSQDQLNFDCDAILKYLSAKGFLHAKVTAQTELVGARGALVIFRVVEGPRSVIEKFPDSRPTQRK